MFFLIFVVFAFIKQPFKFDSLNMKHSNKSFQLYTYWIKFIRIPHGIWFRDGVIITSKASLNVYVWNGEFDPLDMGNRVGNRKSTKKTTSE